MKIKYIVYAILLIVFTALVGYRITKNKNEVSGPGGGGAAGPGGGPGGAPAMRVDGVVVKAQPFNNILAVTGSIEANEQVEIRGQVTGFVQNITFKEGSTVRKGQVLVKVDDSELRAQLAQAQTRQNLSSENAERARLLLEKEAISREEYDIATADFRTAKAQMQLIRAQLSKTTITAPFSGRIGLRNISEGAFLTPDVVVANLVSIDPVKITFSVPEKYASQVKTNTQIKFSVAGSREKYNANVYAIEPGIEATSRTLQLRARAANPSGTIRPGSFASIELPLSILDDALLVPTQAVVPVQNGKKVFVAQQGKAKEVMIETSTRTEKDILVTSGINAGDTVLTTGILTLKEGTPVKVKLPSS